MSNLERLKGAYGAWNKGKANTESVGVLREMMADTVKLATVLPGAGDLALPGSSRSRDDLGSYFASIGNDWEMVHFTPHTFVEQGDTIAMFGTCAWKNKATGKTAECMISNLWRFEDRKVVEFIDLFDSRAAVEAATPLAKS